MIGTMDTPTLVHRWVHGKHFYVRIVWIDPINVIAGKVISFAIFLPSGAASLFYYEMK